MTKTHLKKKFDKGTFDTGASTMKIACWYLISLLFFRSGLIPFSFVLVPLLRLFGSSIGKKVRIKPHIYIKYPWKLKIGDYSWLADCYIDNLEYVIIGSNVCISQQAMLLTGNHDYSVPSFDLIAKPIRIEDGVWICANSTVTAGVIVCSHAVLTAGSTATSLMQAYQIYQGNPAEAIRKRQLF